MGTFGALALSEHQGMFSIGLLLTVAIGFLLLFTLLFLPALLQWAYRTKVA
jgi:predicted RND superfamily exporter protein